MTSLDPVLDEHYQTVLARNPGEREFHQAVLEVLPVSSTFTGFVEEGLVGEAANDFDAIERLRRLAFSDRVEEPEQLRLWKD